MEICSNAVDSQTAKLEEFVLVAHMIRKAGRGAQPGFSKFKLSSSSQAISVALQDRTRSQQASEETQASPLRNDGGPQGELLQRSLLPAASLGIATIPPPESRIESSSGLCTP